MVIMVCRLLVRFGMWSVFIVLVMVVVVWVRVRSALFCRIAGLIMVILIRFVARRG